MDITITIPSDRIANLFSTAIESGDSVTTASRGGWCNGVFWKSRDLPDEKLPKGLWYAEAATYEQDFEFQVIEIDDETTGHETFHRVTRSDVERALRSLAQDLPDIFGQILNDDIDAPCADLFLQWLLFGEERYA